MIEKEVVIVGAGAAGMMCARVSALNGRKVLLVERNARVGKKILISGGGRCNFTNMGTKAQNYVSHNPHFMKSALAGFSPDDFLELIRDHRIAFHEKHKGQLFCDRSSKDIVEMLLAELKEAGVEIWTDASAEYVECLDDGRFELQVKGETVRCEKLVIASGGLSWPKLGVSDFGYQVARAFGHRVTPLAPALVPFEFSAETYRIFGSLAGIALPVKIRTRGLDGRPITFDEDLLFTHRGISGPATLQISLHWTGDHPIEIDLLPELNLFEILRTARQKRPQARVHTLISEYLPDRLSECLTQHFLSAPEKELSNQSDLELKKLADAAHHWSFVPLKTEGYEKAEVTRGGVSVDELSSKNLESKLQPGLFFIGEVVDVTGWLGGYNLQWAWASGYAAGTY